VVGGAIVIAVGLALLSRTLFGVSLEWLEEWWPAALVIFGAYLIFKAKGDQASKSAAAPEDD
jgi:predicted tellurium resistance membrane protein TerC